MNILPSERREQIIRLLVEGNSIRATARLADVSKDTVLKLLVDAGSACHAHQSRMLRDLPCRRIQLDEIWSFIYAKQKRVARAKNAPREAGDVWTWVALCPDTKVVPTWRVGDRSGETALEFLEDLSSRLAHHVQITSDSNAPYMEAVDVAFGQVDYAMLAKKFSGLDHVIGTHATYGSGRADPAHISTSLVERQNLNMRMSIRRFTRQVNAFSRKMVNHAHSVALHFMWYNFCRPHGTLRVTPAMEAGVVDTFMDASDIVTLVDDAIPAPGPRGPYRKRKISK